MDDREIEQLLRRYRPVGPPPGLRDRCLVPPRVLRTWPWAAAAALLLAATMALNSATGDLLTRADLPTAPADDALAVASLTEVLGGDRAAQQIAALIIAEQQMRVDADLLEPPVSIVENEIP